MCALPPGYEDERYCPKDSCFQSTRKNTRGATGGISVDYECCNMTDPSRASAPRGWGNKLSQEYKDELLAAGYHQDECAKGSECDNHVLRRTPSRQPLHMNLIALKERMHSLVSTLPPPPPL